MDPPDRERCMSLDRALQGLYYDELDKSMLCTKDPRQPLEGGVRASPRDGESACADSIGQADCDGSMKSAARTSNRVVNDFSNSPVLQPRR